ncbi:FimB/Mfa2 family fimbrial subunit [uncultured Mediterranea sp.]|uniref:FimB/Mfa2 family fimbrial subunit n=1 Tax=uncultured Mediterranea sp. TaxID=1926662 RepID=UPI0027D9BDEA|nr:FimB/Mfa2 family fimbrial subunit [uncultured Mediterranea sp.]
MKHSTYHYIMGLLATCLLSATFAGCTREADEPAADGRTATIRLDIPMLEAATRITTPTKEQESAIHTLRVIIESDGTTTINQEFKDLTSGSFITIDNVPVGQVQMYVIANEASLGKDYSDLAKLQADIEPETRKVHIHDDGHQYFPKRGSEIDFTTKGLPMEWMGQLTIDPPTDTPQAIEVNLVRAVAKLNITMNNALSDPITINSMSFGPFFGDCLYLFHTSSLDVPDDTKYDEMSYTENINIPIEGNSSETLALYIYPSFAWKDAGQASPYTIGFTTESGGIYTPLPFVNNYGALNSIARNTQVNINATLRTDTHIEIAFEVVPWEQNTVDVPSFN